MSIESEQMAQFTKFGIMLMRQEEHHESDAIRNMKDQIEILRDSKDQAILSQGDTNMKGKLFAGISEFNGDVGKP